MYWVQCDLYMYTLRVNQIWVSADPSCQACCVDNVKKSYTMVILKYSVKLDVVEHASNSGR